MCTGYCYDLVCGHKLIHYATRCPSACEIPDGPRSLLQDTCAPCTPSFQTTNIGRKYDAQRDDTMKQMRGAEALGLSSEVKFLERVIGTQQALRARELYKVTELGMKLSGGGAGQGEVWPGKTEEVPGGGGGDQDSPGESAGEQEEDWPGEGAGEQEEDWPGEGAGEQELDWPGESAGEQEQDEDEDTLPGSWPAHVRPYTPPLSIQEGTAHVD